jgi:hypothetical protein
MRKIKFFIIISLFLLKIGSISAQTDSLMQAILNGENTKPTRITQARAQLQSAFEQEDWGLVNAWLGFMEEKLDDEEYAPTLSDERWLLYFWTGNYSQLFTEVSNYPTAIFEKIQYQEAPNPDDLFALVDKQSYERRYELVKKMQSGFLSIDEKAFGSLLLDYLLRTDEDEKIKAEKNQKITNFLQKYPKSRFRRYAEEYMFDGEIAKKQAWGFDLMLNYGRNTYLLGANFKPNYAFNTAITYGWKKVNFGFRAHFGTQKLRREFSDGLLYFVPDSSASIIDLGLELGFDVLNNKDFRLTPFGGIGFHRLGMTSYNQAEDFGQSEFTSPSWTAGMNFDFKKKDKKDLNFSKKSPYYGLKFRVGYRGLFHKNEALQGNQVFAGIGIIFRS